MRDNFIAWFLSFYNDISTAVKQPPCIVKKLIIVFDFIGFQLIGIVSCGDHFSECDKSVEGGKVAVAADIKSLTVRILFLTVYGDGFVLYLIDAGGNEALT